MKNEPWLLVREGVLVGGGEIILEPEEARHASGSLRLHAGDRVVLADGAGKVAGAQLDRCQRSDVIAVVDEVVTVPSPLPGPTVALGVLHTKAMDWAVQKAVEVGVATFVPLLCDRSQGAHQRALERVDHWRRISRQALKQCRRAWGMVVESPMTIESVVGGRLQPGLVADPEGLVDVSVLESHRMTLLVGPEGGLTLEERKALVSAGWSTIALGPHILRAETAVVVGAALLVQQLQAARGLWPVKKEWESGGGGEGEIARDGRGPQLSLLPRFSLSAFQRIRFPASHERYRSVVGLFPSSLVTDKTRRHH